MNDTKHNVSPASSGLPVMDADAIRRALQRIAHEIVERNSDLDSVVLAGIPSRGVEIARRLAEFIRSSEKIHIETGIVDVAMHRRHSHRIAGSARIETAFASRAPDHRDRG